MKRMGLSSRRSAAGTGDEDGSGYGADPLQRRERGPGEKRGGHRNDKENRGL